MDTEEGIPRDKHMKDKQRERQRERERDKAEEYCGKKTSAITSSGKHGTVT